MAVMAAVSIWASPRSSRGRIDPLDLGIEIFDPLPELLEGFANGRVDLCARFVIRHAAISSAP
jgi:hypothetical protein